MRARDGDKVEDARAVDRLGIFFFLSRGFFFFFIFAHLSSTNVTFFSCQVAPVADLRVRSSFPHFECSSSNSPPMSPSLRLLSSTRRHPHVFLLCYNHCVRILTPDTFFFSRKCVAFSLSLLQKWRWRLSLSLYHHVDLGGPATLLHGDGFWSVCQLGALNNLER